MSNDTLVYVATNEIPGSEEYIRIKDAGMKVFSDAGLNNLGVIDVFVLEAALMYDSSTFLGWGVSEVIDVVEHERQVNNKTHCLVNLNMAYNKGDPT